MTELLCIPFKRTLNVNLKDELAKVIDMTSYQTSTFFKDDLDKISAARETICDSTVSEARLQDIKQYWAYLICLQNKFPDNQIEFTWFQTLSAKSHACPQYSLVFEKMNLLYNIGCMYSLLALDANDGSSSSLKKLCLYFQYSAGCFQYILDHLSDTKEPVVDKNTNLALINVMLAQAQECFWFKSTKDSHKHSLISRLARQVVDYYNDAVEYSRKSELIRSNWVQHLESKRCYFQAVVNYRNGLALGEKNRYGAMVKSLSLALENLKKSEMTSKADFMKTVEVALKNAQRDNDFIYLQQIPSELDSVKPAPMVKPLPISDFLKTSLEQNDCLFRNLLPIAVMESCSAYNERQDEYVRQNITEPLLALNKLLNDDIPRFEVPENLKPISEEQMAHYEFILSDQKNKHDRIKSLHSEIESILEEEAETDEELRKRYGTFKWKLQESCTLNKNFYDKLQKLRDYARQGEVVDQETFTLFKSIDRKLITSPIKLPESNNSVVRDAIALIKRREQSIQDVLGKSLEHRILPKIVSKYKATGKLDFETLFREHLRFFDTDVKYVQEEKEHNKTMSKMLGNQTEETSVKRLEPYKLYIEDLAYSVKLLEEVKSNIDAGDQFYQDLMKSCKALLIETQEFEAYRREQKRELEKKLNVEP